MLKATNSQLEMIAVYEKMYGAKFNGGTYEQANSYIRYYKSKYELDMQKKGILLTDKYEYNYYRYMAKDQLDILIKEAENDLRVKFKGKTLKDAINFIVKYKRLVESPDYAKVKSHT